MSSQGNYVYSMMRSKLLLIAMLAALTAAAQDAHHLGIGSSNVLDTYLSQGNTAARASPIYIYASA